MRSLTPSIIAIIFFTFVQLTSAQMHMKRNSALQRRHTTHLAKRFSGPMTYYAVGLGACGNTNVPSDFIVALNAAQYGSGSYCGASITITCNGKSTQATIEDECPGCGGNGLDLSQGLFEFFADTSAGVLQCTWVFGSSGDSQPTSTTPTWTSTPQAPTTTSTWTPSSTPTPTTTWTPTTTSTSTSSVWTTSSVPSSSPTTTTTSSSSSVPSTSPSPSDGSGALAALNTAISQLAQLVLAM